MAFTLSPHNPVVRSRVASFLPRRAGFLVIPSLLAVFACSGPPAPPPTNSNPATLKAPPNAEMVSVQRVADLIKQGNNRVVVVNFWATWCAPCVEEMPELAAFYREYKDRLTFLSVSVDDPSVLDDGKLASFIKKLDLPFHIHLLDDRDPEAMGSSLGLEFNTIPVTLVYDRSGALSKIWEEEVTSAKLKEVVEPLLR